MSKYKCVKGFNDIYNHEYKVGKYIKDIIIEIGETYNYKQIELPPLEYTALYTDLYKDEVKDSLFSITNRYSSSVSLCYNPTLSMLRSVLESKLYVDHTLPIKLMSNFETYKFNKLDRKQKANRDNFIFFNALYDECELDIENINLALDVFYALGMEKVDLTIFKNGLEIAKFNEVKKALKNMNIFYKCSNDGDNFYDKLGYEFYYDGSLIASGGRHNKLANIMQDITLPSSSLTFDIDELKNIIEYSSLTPDLRDELDFLIVSEDNDYSDCLLVASRLREYGVKVEINYNDYEESRLRDYIDRFNMPYTIITNRKDIKKGIVLVRNSINKEEGKVYFEDFLEELIEHSKHHHEG